MASQFEEVAELIGRIQVLKNQLEETSASIQKQSEANSARLKNDFDEIEGKVDKFLNKAKELTRITNSHYWMVAGGAFLLGVALSVIGCFSFSNWINKDLIEQRALVKIEQERLTKEQQQTSELKAKYGRFEVYDELVSLLEEFREIDPYAIFVSPTKNYLERTLKDDTEDLLLVGIKTQFLTDCALPSKQKCYTDPDKKDYSKYYGIGFQSNGYLTIPLKKKPGNLEPLQTK